MTPTRPAGPSVSVVIAAYSPDRWRQLHDAVASVGCLPAAASRRTASPASTAELAVTL